MTGEIVVRVDPEYADMIPAFLQNRAHDVAILREAMARRDLEGARKTGHTLKGVGGSYGFPAISAVGARIEDAAEQGHAELVTAAIEELADYLGRVRVESAEAP